RHAASLLLLLFGSMQWPSESAPPEGWPLGQFLEEKPMVKGSNKAADRLAKLEEQRARINAEIQRVRAREQQQERKNETRRKVLVGAMILAKVNSSEWPEDRLMAAMDAYLERDHDRALFGLPPRQKDEPG
ncbi:hypothetical protein EsDP_00007467, partial [Epichloe bromicola]